MLREGHSNVQDQVVSVSSSRHTMYEKIVINSLVCSAERRGRAMEEFSGSSSHINKSSLEIKKTGMQHIVHCTDCSEQTLNPKPLKPGQGSQSLGRFLLTPSHSPCLSELQHPSTRKQLGRIISQYHREIEIAGEPLSVRYPHKGCHTKQRAGQHTRTKSDMGFYSNTLSPWHLIQIAPEHSCLHLEKEIIVLLVTKKCLRHTPLTGQENEKN